VWYTLLIIVVMSLSKTLRPTEGFYFMMYSIRINQIALAEIAPNLDVIDASIIDFIYSMCASASSKIVKSRINDDKGVWTWINYNHLIKELPMIKIKSPGAITARIKKIESAGLIKTMKGSGYKLYVKLMPKMDSAFIYMNASVHQNESQRSSKRTYHSTNNHNTSNQSARAKATALFLGDWDSGDLKDYIDGLGRSKAQHRRIIAQYLKTKGFSVKQFENKKQVEAEVARNARVAVRLAKGG